ncbi:lysozyme inhibitor LprI family protein [Cronobacter malonaticus]
MKNLINSALLMLALNPLCAQADEITRSAATDACTQQTGENSGECLEAAGLASDNALKQAFNAKVTELQNFDYTRWPQGDEARRTQMVEALKISQQQWTAARDAFCTAASASAAGTPWLAAHALGCVINMNQRREQELALIHPEAEK